MFDLIEESMSHPSQLPEEQKKAPIQAEGVVYVMPEKFLTPASNGPSKVLIAGIVGVVGLIVVASVAAIVLGTRSSSPSITQQPTSSAPISSEPVAPTLPATPQEEEVEEQIVSEVKENGGEKAPVESKSTPGSEEVSRLEGSDKDRDQLTDAEEVLYGTDSTKPDTDNDGFFDGNEVRFLYSPLTPSPAKLSAMAAMSVYTNPTFKYSFLYPSQWAAKAMDPSNREVTIASSTGELVTITVLDNAEALSVEDWVALHGEGGLSKPIAITQGTWSILLSDTGLAAYLTQDKVSASSKAVSTPFVYKVEYIPGTANELQFKVTFEAIVRSIAASN